MTAFEAGLLAFLVLCAAGCAASLLLLARRTPLVVATFGAVASVPVVYAGTLALFAPPGPPVTLWTVPPLGAVVVQRDPLSGLFLVITGLVFLATSVFGAESLRRLLGSYNVRAYALLYFGLFAAVVWVIVAADVFSFLVAWESMSVLSYFLVVFEDKVGQHRRAGFLMLALGEAGALAAALGLLLLAAHGAGLEFAQLKAAGLAATPTVRLIVFLLTFFGFGVKAGLVPVNAWLPGAYAAAPDAFVPVLAGATLNLGLYGILRVNADLLPAASIAPGLIALVVGAVSALLGILYATTNNDLKALLAHSSIENAGIMTVGFGAGLVFLAADKPALAAIGLVVGLYHLLNHSLYKSLLFMGSGIVDQRAGTRDLDRLGGLIHRLPWTAVFVLAGVLSIAAFPPFNGFVSEWLTLQTLLRSAELASTGVKIVFALCGAALALTAALAVTCFAKAFAMGFLGMTRSPEAEGAREAGASVLVSMGFLAVLCLLLGVTPTYVIGILDRVVQPIAHSSAATALVPPFFEGSAGHEALAPAFAADFRALGAQVGEQVLPGPGLVLLHQGEVANPVVFAAAPAYLAVVLAGIIALAFMAVRGLAARREPLRRAPAWDGGIRRLLPEMTYTATGFSNPVRVIFQAIFRPRIVEDTRETVAEHFRTAIRRESETVHIVDRLILRPLADVGLALARLFARMHHGQLNAYTAYVLLALLAVLIGFHAR